MSKNKSSEEKLKAITDWMRTIDNDKADEFESMLTPRTTDEVESITCPECIGTGTFYIGEDPTREGDCARCEGRGYIWRDVE